MYRPKPCEKCLVIFQPSHGRSKFCLACLTYVCVWCGSSFKSNSASPSGFRTNEYCSLKCRSAKRFDGARIDMACRTCGTIVSRTKSTLRGAGYCSVRCRAIGVWNSPYREKIIAAIKASPSLHTPERRAQLAAAVRNRGPASDETRAKIRAARMRQSFPTKLTKIEKLLHDEFTRLEMEFVMHRPFYGQFQPDFVFERPRIVVQADGDYWHSLPAAIKRDARFNAMAEADGWRVFRFTETEILADVEGCALVIHCAANSED